MYFQLGSDAISAISDLWNLKLNDYILGFKKYVKLNDQILGFKKYVKLNDQILGFC